MTTNRSSYSPRTDPTQLAKTLFDELSCRYHQERQRNIAAEISPMLARYRPGEAESFLNLALNWAPYGGIPEDEVFERFGTTVACYFDQLWAIVRHLQCDHETVAKLTAAYPKHRTTLAETPESLPLWTNRDD